MKKISFVLLISVITFASGQARCKLIVNVGYKQNYSFLEYPEVLQGGYHRKLHGVNMNVGIRKNKFEYGVYYGIGSIKKFGKLDERYNVLPGTTGNMHNYAVYSNLYLSSFINHRFFTDMFNFYATGKVGGFYVPSESKDFTPSGAGFNCFAGVGASFYLLKRFGLFCESGYDYYPKKNHVKMSKISTRLGVSLRL